MDIFLRFNRKAIDDRQIDTLIGLSKGLLADGKVDQSEAEFLFSWLVQNRRATDNPIILNLLSKVSSILEDGVLDPEESQELFELLQKISGEPTEFGEIAKTTSLPLDSPAPVISFPDRSFLFTGTCAYGTRKQCQYATISLGGLCAKGVTKTLDYLVLGTYVTDSWAHEVFGRKIEKAMQYRDNGVPLAIVSEEAWANSGKLI
jgi:NAD-dependent DNA ligase